MSPEEFLATYKNKKVVRQESIDKLVKSALTARELISLMLSAGITMNALSAHSKVNATCLRLHYYRGQPLSPKSAKKLARWSGGVISDVKMYLQDEIA